MMTMLKTHKLLRILGFMSLFLLVFAFFVLDPFFGYQMCSLCLAQRVVLTCVGVLLVWSSFCAQASMLNHVLNLLVVLLGIIGVGLSVWHLMLQYVYSNASCPLLLSRHPSWWWSMFLSRYHWTPCQFERAALLGMPLSALAGLFFVVVTFTVIGLWYHEKLVNQLPSE
ncbi:MAG: disulfide bond formation protein B [Pseudomonadota bacterium]|nr:disulfide bond formation protein B [Pseudomonadota bacterium]